MKINRIRDKHKHTHSRYAKHNSIELEKTVTIKVEDSKEDTNGILDISEKNKWQKFLNNQKLLHEEELQQRDEKIQDAKNNLAESKTKLAKEKDKLKDIKESLKAGTQKLKAEKKRVKTEKKALKKAKKKNYGLGSTTLVILLSLVSVFLFFTVKWLFRTWPNLKMEELIYQITTPMEGTGTDMYWQFFYQVGIPSLVFLVIIIVLIIIISHCSKTIRNRGKMAIICLSLVTLMFSGVKFDTQLDAGNYLKSKSTDSLFIEENYVDPSSVVLTFPETKRNLITIYLESMEMTYSNKENGGGFDDNYIPNLTELSEENENFSDTSDTLNGAVSLTGTTWTSGGIFASTSGLPLIVDKIYANDMDTQDTFFEKVTALGDILEDNGYQNVFSCGSDATFGGRRLYFQTHGNYDIRDINYRKETGELPEDYYVWWGYEDEKLIQFAKDDLNELASSDQPFNYSMLTVDTHFEDGYVCDLCEDEYPGNQYANVISCSDRQVSELVSWIQQQDWYENTTIVITGDHPTMDSDFCDPVSPDYQRRVYTAYINAQPTENNSSGMRKFSTFDTFPTILAAMGVSIDGNRLGLGTNLFSGEETLVEKDGIDFINNEFSKNSTFMSELANVNPNASGMRDRGSGIGMQLQLTSIDQNTLKFSCSDLYGINGTLNGIDVTSQDSDGNTSSALLKYEGKGNFKGSIDIPNGDLENVYLKFDVHSTDSDGNEVVETIFEYSGNIQLLNCQTDNFSQYLEALSNIDLNRYTIFVTAQSDGVTGLSEKEKILLGKIGAGNVASSDGNAAFAIIDENESYSKLAKDYLREDGVLSDGTPYVISSSSNDEQVSSILLGDDYTEYSYQQNGLNFVVWDSVNHCVVSQKGFSFGNSPAIDDVSVKTSLLNSDVEVIASNPTYSDSAAHIVAVMYDENDASDREEKIMSLNYDNTYICTFENVKKDLKKKTISVYATFDDGSRKLLGTWESDR